MKTIILYSIILGFITISTISNAQELGPESFDFWVGQWDLTWDDGDGKVGKGTNHIIKTLDDKVIQENFEAVEGQLTGFKGTSISVYNANNKTWRQAWADNQGGYFNFVGDSDGDKKIFKTQPVERDNKTIILRMVFYDFSNNTLTWDWERSEDGGKTWNLSWRINYARVK